jgi:hypothetical protein
MTKVMELRKHPLMSHGPIPNWPPICVWRSGNGKERIPPYTEIGILKEIWRAYTRPELTLFLIITHEGNEYTACLMFKDCMFCTQIYTLLTEHVGDSIKDIGSLDVSHIL